MEVPFDNQQSGIDPVFLADVLTQFSARLAALELEKQLTVLNPIWKPRCGHVGCAWQGESSNDYRTAVDAAYNHTRTMHQNATPVIVVEKNS